MATNSHVSLYSTSKSCCSLLVVLFLSGLTLAHGEPPSTTPSDRMKTGLIREAVLGSKTIRVVHAQTDETRYRGLLGWNSIDEETGMLLDFVTPALHAIHMQGMKFPIDAVWIDEQNIVKHIHSEIRPNSGRIYDSPVPCRYCLELKAGFCRKYGVGIGGAVFFR